jgi:outer membrane protein OmpA-like peptidoglycan-associated protein
MTRRTRPLWTAPYSIAARAPLFALAVGLIAGPVAGQEQVISNEPSFCEVFVALSNDVPAECAAEASAIAKPGTRGIRLPTSRVDGQTGAASPTPTNEAATGSTTSAPRPAATPEPTATTTAAAPSQPRQRPAQKAASFGSVQFAYDSADLTTAAQASLDVLARVLKDGRLARSKFLIEGHTDAAGSRAYNQTLSERRARSVVRYLVRQGVSRNQMRPRGLGETRLADPSRPEAGVNRRVVIINLNG